MSDTAASRVGETLAIQIIRFADFELDLGRYQLRRGDHVVKLEKAPMELLILLVEKQGELVTREEIIRRLWGDNVFVDTRHGINTAVHKLRAALRDDSERPRILETVVGKGYRLVANLAATPRDVASLPGDNQDVPDSGLQPHATLVQTGLHDSAENPAFVETVARRGHRFIGPVNSSTSALSRRTLIIHRKLFVITSAVVALFTLLAGGYFYFHWTRKLIIKETVVSAHFDTTMSAPASDAAGVSKNAASSSSASARIQNILPGDIRRRVRHAVVPVYPEAAMRAHVIGTVEIGVGISPQGDVGNYRVLLGPPMLIPAAVDAIRKWKFQPNVVQGEPTWSRTRALVRFGADGTTAVAFAHPILPDSFGDLGTQRNEALEAAIPAVFERSNSSAEILQKRHQRQVELARRSAEAGDPWGQTLLGIYYQDGVGVEKDAHQAFDWFTKAAEQDFADAEYHLGRMYEGTQGIPQDYAAAVAWYRKAANHTSLLDGAMGSRRRLARLYLLGLGVPQDCVQADMLIRIAGADPLAHRIHSAEDARLLQMEAKMTPAQIAEAQRRADEWIAQHKTH
jgi:TonB family protein